MNEDGFFAGMLTFMVLALLVLTHSMACDTGREEIRDEALAQGHAEEVLVDSQGEFQWNCAYVHSDTTEVCCHAR